MKQEGNLVLRSSALTGTGGHFWLGYIAYTYLFLPYYSQESYLNYMQSLYCQCEGNFHSFYVILLMCFPTGQQYPINNRLFSFHCCMPVSCVIKACFILWATKVRIKKWLWILVITHAELACSRVC